jgi:hypothetical protein
VASLNDLRSGAFVNGLAPSCIAKVVQVEWYGDQATKVTYEDCGGNVRNRLVYRNEEPTLAAAAANAGMQLKVVDPLRDEARDLYRADLVLIRPDQVVAWRGNSDEAAADIVRRVLGLEPGMKNNPDRELRVA